MQYRPSKYQEEIYDFVLHGAGNAFVSAKAGAGKTTTMVEAMKLVPEKNRCVFIAFNKSIVKALGEKVEDHPNCSVSTVHSLGMSIIRKEFPDVEIDEFKYDTYLRKNIGKLSENTAEIRNGRTFNAYFSNIRKLVDLSRLFLCQSEKEIGRLASERSVDIMYDEPSVVEKVLSWGRENLSTVDFTDMVWLPNELLLKPSKRYDWVFCDEVQDFSVAYYRLVKKCLKRGGRMFSVGDEKQMINGFAGASELALNELKNAPNTSLFTLPICYRCGKSIVRLAKKYVPDITPMDEAEEGIIVRDCGIDMINGGDLVLCRTRAPLAKLYMTLLKRDIKCYISGNGLVSELVRLLDESEYEKLNADVFEKGVFYSLYSELFAEIRRLSLAKGVNADDVAMSNSIMRRYDSITTLRLLSEGCATKNELMERLKSIESYEGRETFNGTEKSENGVCLSTIHKSKGSESDNVFILSNPSLSFSENMSEWEKEQEENLEYVAITRARHLLAFISEKHCPKCGRQQSRDEILKELHTVEALVNSIDGNLFIGTQYEAEAVKMKVENTLSKPKLNIGMNIAEASPPVERKSVLLDSLSKYRKKH